MAQNVYSQMTQQESPADTWRRMIMESQALGEDADGAQLAQLAQAINEPKPQGPQSVKTAVTHTTRTQQEDPAAQEERAQMLELVKQYGQASTAALAQQQQGVGQMESKINEMQNKPMGWDEVNFKPLAAFYGMRPDAMPTVETEQQRQTRFLGLQQELQKAKQGVSKEQVEALKNQITAYKAAKDTSLQDELTRSRIDLNKTLAGQKADGKIIPEVAVGKISDFDNGLTQLIGLSPQMENNKTIFGPVSGFVGGLNKYNVKAQTVQGYLDTAKQVIGKAVEGGVLRKEDEEKYKKMLPVLTDLPEVALSKWTQFINKLQTDRATYVGNLNKAGYNAKSMGRAPINLSDETPVGGTKQGTDGIYKRLPGPEGDRNSWEKVQ